MKKLSTTIKKLLKKQEQPLQEKQLSYIITNVRELKKQLDGLENSFNLTSDTDLIESCIYEQNALMARYRYFIKLAKEIGQKQTQTVYIPAFEEKEVEKILG